MGVFESQWETGYILSCPLESLRNCLQRTTGDIRRNRLPKLKVAGSNPVSRSNIYQRLKTEAREGRLVPKVKKKAFPTVREIVEDRVSGFTGRARTNERKYADWWIGRMGDRTIETVSPGELRKLLSVASGIDPFEIRLIA